MPEASSPAWASVAEVAFAKALLGVRDEKTPAFIDDLGHDSGLLAQRGAGLPAVLYEHLRGRNLA